MDWRDDKMFKHNPVPMLTIASASAAEPRTGSLSDLSIMARPLGWPRGHQSRRRQDARAQSRRHLSPRHTNQELGALSRSGGTSFQLRIHTPELSMAQDRCCVLSCHAQLNLAPSRALSSRSRVHWKRHLWLPARDFASFVIEAQVRQSLLGRVRRGHSRG